MATNAYVRRLRIEILAGQSEVLEEPVASVGNLKVCFEAREQPRRSLHRANPLHVQRRFFQLRFEILGPVEVRRREVVRIARRVSMLAVDQVALDDPSERRVVCVMRPQSIEHRRVTADRRREEHAPRSKDAAGFPKDHHALATLGEVIQGAEQQHHVGALVRPARAAGIAQRRTFQWELRLAIQVRFTDPRT
jgi:hypothetical protein